MGGNTEVNIGNWEAIQIATKLDSPENDVYHTYSRIVRDVK